MGREEKGWERKERDREESDFGRLATQKQSTSTSSHKV